MTFANLPKVDCEGTGFVTRVAAIMEHSGQCHPRPPTVRFSFHWASCYTSRTGKMVESAPPLWGQIGIAGAALGFGGSRAASRQRTR
jgi:hypothetical protein